MVESGPKNLPQFNNEKKLFNDFSNFFAEKKVVPDKVPRVKSLENKENPYSKFFAETSLRGSFCEKMPKISYKNGP